MSLVEHILETRTPLEMAKIIKKLAEENAALKDQVDALKHELFWIQANERTANT